MGRAKNVRFDEGLVGDIKLRKHELLEMVLDDAEENTLGIGISQNADGDGRNGVITKITRVNSLDLVANPATTTHLFEDEEATAVVEEEKTKELEENLNKYKTDVEGTITSLKSEIDNLKKNLDRLNNQKQPLYKPAGPVDASTVHNDWLNSIKRKN